MDDVDHCSGDALESRQGMVCALDALEVQCDCGLAGFLDYNENGRTQMVPLDGMSSLDDMAGAVYDWWEKAEATPLVWIDELCVAQIGERSFPSPTWCPGDFSGRWLPCEEECGIWVGTRVVGQSCQFLGRRMSDCAPGLVCGVDELCHVPCTEPTEGSVGHLCGYEVGVVNSPCAAGLVCQDNRCVVGSALGESCSEQAPCAVPLRCLEGLCTEGKPPGSACALHSECASRICTEDGCAGDDYCPYEGESCWPDELGPYPNHCREWSW